MNSKLCLNIAVLFTHTLILPLAIPLYAQSTGGQLEEVTVTTQYRKQSSQDLAVTNTLVSSSDIAHFDVHGNTSLAAISPGMSHAEFASGQSYLAIRGILSVDDGPGMDASVVAFVDGVYIGRLSNIDFDLLDIERIEVLRGPQGTLFGRNAIGGAINIITKVASHENAATLSATAGNYGTLRYSTSINGGLSDAILGRLSFSHREHSGYTENILLNEDNQDENKYNLRGQLRYVSEHHEWRLSADYASDDSADMGRFPVTESNLRSRAQWLALGGETGRSTAPITGFSERAAQGLHLNGNTQFDKSQWQNIFAWRNSRSNWAMATTGAPIGVNPPFPAPDIPSGVFGSDIRDHIDEDIDQHSIESRWLRPLSPSLHLSAGIFLYREETIRTEQYQLVENSIASGESLVGNEITRQRNKTASQALYSQLQWDLNPRWNLTIGARWTKDRKTTESTSLNCGLPDPLVSASQLCEVESGAFLNLMNRIFQISAQKSWTDLSPKVTLQFQKKRNSLLYATIAKGFKSGGFPGSPGSEAIATTPVNPESAWNFELGQKTDLRKNTLRLNSSVFYTDYRDLQIVRFGPSPDNPGFGSFTTTNIGEADIYGVEFEAQWLVTEQLQLGGNYGYLRTEIHDLFIETTNGIIDASGSELRQAPKHKYLLSAEYRHPVKQEIGQLLFHIDHQYIDEQLSDYVNKDTRIDALRHTNGRITWENQKANMSVSLWIKNIENKRQVAHAYTVAGGVYGIWSSPRTAGITINWTVF